MKLIVGFLLVLLLSLTAAAQLPVSTKVITYKGPDSTVELSLPQVEGVADPLLLININLHLHYPVVKWAFGLSQVAKEDYEYHQLDSRDWPWRPYHISSEYQIHLNNEEHLSITQMNHQYTGGAHGLSYLSGLTVQLPSGKVIDSIDELEVPSNYQEIILKGINHQIANNPEYYFYDEVDYFPQFSFYLTEDGLVVYYQLYEIAPYATGIPRFLITWESLGL